MHHIVFRFVEDFKIKVDHVHITSHSVLLSIVVVCVCVCVWKGSMWRLPEQHMSILSLKELQ